MYINNVVWIFHTKLCTTANRLNFVGDIKVHTLFLFPATQAVYRKMILPPTSLSQTRKAK